MNAPGKRLRYVLLAVGLLAMATGLWAGLRRIGVDLPEGLRLDEVHGALMICGFFGTLISLERAVALARPWPYAAPAFAACGALMLLAGATSAAVISFLAASAVLTAATVTVLRRHPALFTAVLAIAAFCWGAGTFVWTLQRPMPEAAGWWLAFLVLTIAAERLELSRLLRPSPAAGAIFMVTVALILAGTARGELARGYPVLTGFGYLACVAWLLTYDIARRTVRQRGQTRFSAVCLLSGYGWLGVTGLYLLLAPPGAGAYAYDAAVHGIALGFVLSMVFGHALIILPAITGWRVRYHPALYVPLALLHAAVALRICADFAENVALRVASGPLAIVALMGFAGTLLIASAWRPSVRPQLSKGAP